MALMFFQTRENVVFPFDVALAECSLSPDMINYIYAAHNTCVNGLSLP